MSARRPPRVHYERGANLGAEMPLIPGDRAQHVSGDAEQLAVDDPFVVPLYQATALMGAGSV